MEYLRKCITPRTTTNISRNNSDDSISSGSYPSISSESSESSNDEPDYFYHASSSEERVRKINEYHYKKALLQSKLKTRIPDRPDFLCTFGLQTCYHNVSEIKKPGSIEEKWDSSTFSPENNKKYNKTDGSFLLFHLRVLFCLE